MNIQDSKIISGVAIILMIILHLLADPTYYPQSLLINDKLIISIATGGKICVSFFAFISGYGLWKSYKNVVINKRTFISQGLKRLLKFYTKFWPICLLGAIFKYVFMKHFSVSELVFNLVGWKISYNYTWWYIRYYILMSIVLFPLSFFVFYKCCSKIIEKYKNRVLIMILVLMIPVCVLVSGKLSGALCLASFLSGEIIAEIELIEKIRNNIKLTVVLFVIGILIRSLYTNDMGLLTLDYLCVPMMIPGILELFNRIKSFKKIILKVGNHSTTMWLCHAFFFMYSDYIREHMPDGFIGFCVILLLTYFVAFLWDTLYLKLKQIKENVIIYYEE